MTKVRAGRWVRIAERKDASTAVSLGVVAEGPEERSVWTEM